MKVKAYAAQSHQGPYLEVNEDGHEADVINGLYMVLDGYGGSGIGDKAVDLVRKKVKHFFTRINEDSNATLPFYYSKKYLLEGNALINAVHFAHRNLMDENEKLDLSSRGGASGVLTSLSDNIVTIVSTGNCRAYLYRKGRIENIIREKAGLVTTAAEQDGNEADAGKA